MYKQSVDLYLTVLWCYLKEEYINSNLNQIHKIDHENREMFLVPDEVNIGLVARETLENYGSNNPDKLDILTLKSNYNNVILNARIYLIKMAKQIK